MCGRCDQPVSASPPSTAGVIGAPLRATRMKPTCQSFVITSMIPEPSPGRDRDRRRVEQVPTVGAAVAFRRVGVRVRVVVRLARVRLDLCHGERAATDVRGRLAVVDALAEGVVGRRAPVVRQALVEAELDPVVVAAAIADTSGAVPPLTPK